LVARIHPPCFRPCFHRLCCHRRLPIPPNRAPSSVWILQGWEQCHAMPIYLQKGATYIYIYIYTHTYIHTSIHAYRQTDRQTYTHT
jgi:hypothetical protein